MAETPLVTAGRAILAALEADGISPDTLVAKAAMAPADADAVCTVMKAEEERQFTLGVAYPALRHDVKKAQDGCVDFMGPEELEKTAWSWMAKSRQIGLQHVDGTEGHGTPVESYIYRGPDWHLQAANGTDQVIKSGDWVLGVVWDDPAWGLVKKGFIGGYSPQGMSRRTTPGPERLAELRSE